MKCEQCNAPATIEGLCAICYELELLNEALNEDTEETLQPLTNPNNQRDE